MFWARAVILFGRWLVCVGESFCCMGADSWITGRHICRAEKSNAALVATDFFTRWDGRLGIFGGVSLWGWSAIGVPAVLSSRTTTFKAGLPEDYAMGEVSAKYKQVRGFGSCV